MPARDEQARNVNEFLVRCRRELASIGEEPRQAFRILCRRLFRAGVSSDLLGVLLEQHVNRKQVGAYYTGRDVTAMLARHTVIPFLFDYTSARCPRVLRPGGPVWRLLRKHPERYLAGALRRGVAVPLPEVPVAERNAFAPAEVALPLETWREHRHRRQHCQEMRERLRSGAVHTIDEAVTCNLDLFQLALDALAEGPPELVHVWAEALRDITILDPTCGSGEFLLAAVDVLEPLLRACQARSARPGSADIAALVRKNLHGIDLLDEAVEICRMRLLLRAGSKASPADLGGIAVGNILDRNPVKQPFDVILGNPPYVEIHWLREAYPLQGYRTARCGNLAALVVERSLELLAPTGRCGLVVPLSLASTARMRPVQEVLVDGRRTCWLSFYDVYPTRLFPGAKQRLCILLTSAVQQRTTFFTTRYCRWKPAERPHLLATLRYWPSFLDTEHCVIPRLHDRVTESIYRKLLARRPAAYEPVRDHVSFYVHRIPYNYVKAVDFVPYFWNAVDGRKKSEDYKPYCLHNRRHERAALVMLNSNLFFWWWYTRYEGYHCGQHEVQAFPAGLEELTPRNGKRLSELADRLMHDLRRHRQRKTCTYRHTGKVVYEEFYPSRSRPILAAIDEVLADHFGFTGEELDFIINYDIKYRLPARETGNSANRR